MSINGKRQALQEQYKANSAIKPIRTYSIHKRNAPFTDSKRQSTITPSQNTLRNNTEPDETLAENMMQSGGFN